MILAVTHFSRPSKMYATEVIDDIRKHMIVGDHSLSVAESVTSGHLQAALSLATDASKFFHGGITVYNLGQKARHLHVNPIHATSCNSVSQTVADEMALNAVRFFSSDWAIAVTGYGSPMPQMGIKSPFAFFTIARHSQIVCRGRLDSEDDGLLNVQVRFANTILRHFRNHLSGIGDPSRPDDVANARGA